MRKIRMGITLDSETFDPFVSVILKETPDSDVTILHKEAVSDQEVKFINKLTSYSSRELYNIFFTNKILLEKGHAIMTDEEMDFFTDPTRTKHIEKLIKDPEDLQKLSGFMVEKKVVYTDKNKSDTI